VKSFSHRICKHRSQLGVDLFQLGSLRAVEFNTMDRGLQNTNVSVKILILGNVEELIVV
jgi:hypothetical protein